MKAKILIRKKIKASSSEKAMKIIKTKYPRARFISYCFDKDFRYESNRDYKNRTITIAFVDDYKKINLG